MGEKNYVKLQNQGNIISNMRLLYEMKNSDGYTDENEYFSKKDIAEIGVNSLLITGAGGIGQDIVDLVHDTSIREGDNGVLQNTKARMQILRILGFVSTDYASELYAITDLGEKVIKQSLNQIPSHDLLLESFMGITSTSEVYDYNCDISFNCYLGYEICYAFASLDYIIGVKEMPIITTFQLEEIDEFVILAKKYRAKGKIIPDTEEHYPKKKNGDPLKSDQITNITRTINQILRICNIMEKKTTNIDGLNYYVCTDYGKSYVTSIKDAMNKKTYGQKLKFWTPQEFRKQNLIEQKIICNSGYNNMLNRGGYNAEVIEKNVVFSPYQLIPEVHVNAFLGKDIRKPPLKREQQIQEINDLISTEELKLRPIYNSQEEYDEFIKLHISHSNLIEEIINAKTKGINKEELIQELLERHKMDDKENFYPYIHSLLRAMGLDCKGEVGRIDAYMIFHGHVVPAEIKSFTETTVYNLKGMRQAIENKIYSYNDYSDMEYSSLVIGFGHPGALSEIKNFIEATYEELGIKIITIDLLTLIKMCIKVVWDKKAVDFEKLFTSYGIIVE